MKKICDCPCHTTPGIIHAFPCCDNGLIEAQPTPNIEYITLKGSVERMRNFIVSHEAAALTLERPLPERLPCPACEGILFLSQEPLAYSIEGYGWLGIHYFYKCGTCEERFTTTDSDTRSIASLKEIN